MPAESPREYAITMTCSRDQALQAAGTAAEEWGARLERDGSGFGVGSGVGGDGGAGVGGRLDLPVVAGLRRGLLSGPLLVTAEGAGSRVTFAATSEDYHLEVPAVAILALAGAGALLTVIWPLAPKLLPLAPLGALLALSGWFLVLSRRSGKGPGEFLKSIQDLAGRAEEFPPPPGGI